MSFKLINIDEWSRKEFYEHFMHEVVCTYSITVNVDVTNIRGQRLYPTMLWLLTSTVNDFEEFRTHLSSNGVGIFDKMNPSYTIFNKANKNFSIIWTEFSDNYDEFLQRYLKDNEEFSKSICFAPKPHKPSNCFDISALPWIKFTSLNINVYDSGKYLLPVFTIGRKFEENDRTLIPLAVQVHHAVCDGYHVAVFVKELQKKINDFDRVK